MTTQQVAHYHDMKCETNVVHVVKLETGFIVENQRGPAQKFSSLEVKRHAVLDIDEAFRLARELMEAPVDDDGKASGA